MSFSLSLTIKKILSDIFDIKNEKIDASRLEGTIPIETLPPAALERVIIVKDDAARFALTKEKAQNGDTVKVNDTKKMYFVNDDTKLNVEDGYEEYVTGGAASAAIADKAKLAIDSEKLGGLTLENIRNEVKTYPANLQDQSIKNRHLAPDLKITADNIADNTITKNQLSLRAGDLDAYTKRESNEAIERAVNALKGATPQVLDTLQKIAAALNNDPNFATTITNALNSKVNKSGDTMTGNLAVPSIYTNNWFRARGDCGFYFEDHDGGWYMTDNEWIRAYNGKHIYTSGKIRCDVGFEGDLRGKAATAGIADMTIKIKGNKLVFENGTELWIE